ncbi:chemotaxis protein CheW [Thiothrix lacustris]|uniref:Chemotaxis protein CheW n=1 Tax=Thiothrix lacustris TaxID=525917 RepID=A0ABY9MKQ7_9GAMM|nr:chemotaxis protein CheW [Thiothrix lacustris]WML89186.1 chemotaxis protein CheW [Thiothrix lacustris]WMP19214.1 chemotaxis protein CheW [Thiothrix lacustris]
MASPYELLAGLALLREKKRRSRQHHAQDLQEWSGFQVTIGEITCLIPCDQVEEVVTPSNIALVRGVPPWISGVVYCRAQLVTLVDLASLLRANGRSNTSGRAFVVRGTREWFGLQAGNFEGVRHIWSDTPSCETPTQLTGDWLRYTHQWLLLDNHPTAVLDATRLITALESGEIPV